MKLRYVLFAAFSLVTLIPVLVFGVWPHSVALQSQIEDVADRHLLLAQNLSSTLERYNRDVKATFVMLAETLVANHETIGGAGTGIESLLTQLSFRHLCIVDPTDGRVIAAVAINGVNPPRYLPADRLSMLRELGSGDSPAYSEVVAAPNDGTPILYIAHRIGDLLAVGVLTTDYLVELSETVTFGRHGHAAIVDHTGRIMAHPLEDWRLLRRDISDLPPVARLLNRESGISLFESPAFNGQMIAGFTSVPEANWGVMIPQPFAELEERAEQFRRSALGVIIVGILVAGLVSWVLSGILTRPVLAVASAARRMKAGDASARVESIGEYAPRELRDLQKTFNSMAKSIEASIRHQNEARGRAEIANRAKTQFLANMSHELRTPLNAIIGFSEIMKDDLFGPVGKAFKYRDYAKDIHQSGSYLLEMISDILDMSKIEAGEIELNETVFDVLDAVDRCVDVIKTRARKKQIEIQQELSGPRLALRGDERMFRQIVLNLLSNAVKFTPTSGAIRIAARLNRAGQCEIHVHDTGVGVAESEIQSVMQPFQRGHYANNNRVEGTGLGLSIVLSLTALHGGRFRLNSAVNEGTDAIVTFPAERVSLLPEAKSA